MRLLPPDQRNSSSSPSVDKTMVMIDSAMPVQEWPRRPRVDGAALERILATIELRLIAMRLTTIAASEIVALPRGHVVLAYVTEGSVRGIPAFRDTCTLDIDRTSNTVRPEHAALVAGDSFLSLGHRSSVLEARSDATIMVIELALSESADHIAAVLPDSMAVTGFAGLEPVAAALAEALAVSMRLTQPKPPELRSSDPVICRMMATTILLSVIRAWAENGCAPSGWPSVSGDPFLDRVVTAIRNEPGRDWTVDLLANLGAMSRSVFAERFRAALGRTPASYVTEVRMDAAKGMLAAGRSVSDVSRSAGYASDEGFSRAFRRSTGMTPSAWRASRSPAGIGS
ncbi:AraC family transcriptional regulator [Saxibacter everestensis]|uniref:AraC family transcriptional regulator n=1 Tax=Saxibacter everestensis TaxID=2909229 RepID=A0ABY8QSR4_9MICO|nr:AraC family transcriptional regulator [Brevibacteriaceae bacterium ZFBP1038]